MYRLCIFDLDGTLLNTVYALTYVTNLTLDAFGLRHVTPESILNDVDFYRRKLRGLRYVAARSIGFARCVHFAMYS